MQIIGVPLYTGEVCLHFSPSLAVQTLGKKSEKKRAPTSAIKQSAPRPIRGSTTCASAVKDREREEAEEFPDIETMSRRGESDDC